MQQFLNIWTELTFRKQLTIIVATVAMFFGVLAMSRMVSSPNMTLLYAGLESGAAGDVVRALEQRGVVYEVRGGSIFVDSKARDELRLTLASEGLPANGNRGYELLDNLTGFGTTSQMFDAAYWRAKEGELARTIVANPQISMARVHISGTGSNPFQRGVVPKASVSLTPNGGEISAAEAKAVRFLVASAVAGLSPDDVAVIDANGSLIGSSDDAMPTSQGDDKADMFKEKIQRILEARVGLGNAIVEVSVDTETESESVRERRFDPDGRVAISTDTEERSNTSSDAGNGDVTVASNLPSNDGQAGGDSSSSSNSETRERVNYEVSETEREIVRAPGAVKRITVAVLINDTIATDEGGTEVSQPRDDTELEALRELVSSAVGFDAERGDIITIKSMALQSIPPMGTQATTSIVDRFNLDLMSAIQIAVLGLVTIILGLFVVRPLLSRQPLPDPNGGFPALTSDQNGGQSDQQMNDMNLAIGSQNAGQSEFLASDEGFQGGMEPGSFLPMMGGGQDTQVDRLRGMIGDKQEETIEILRSWLEEKEENA